VLDGLDLGALAGGRLGRSVRTKVTPALAGAGWIRTLPALPLKRPTPSNSAGFWMVR
jgi:hypothetical protein